MKNIADPTIVLLRHVLAVLLAAVMLAAPALADYASGLKAYQDGDHKLAFSEWGPLAATGDARAQHGLGLLYEAGQGVAPDPKEAARWYEAAAAQGLSAARNNLALLYAEGRGVIRNINRAVELWRQAADAGYPMAQFNLGLVYYRGIGAPKNYREAVKFFTMAADRGVPTAQYALAEAYRLGRGVNKDLDVARTWYAEAARNGHVDAAVRMKELFGVTVMAEAPAADPSPVEEAARPAGTAEDAAAAAAVGNPAPSGGFRVWLSSLPTQEAAERSWRDLVTAYPDLLEKLTPTIRRFDLGSSKGIRYRVFAGPLISRAAADSLCAALKKRSPDEGCLVIAE
jgi:TPR repeat protein